MMWIDSIVSFSHKYKEPGDVSMKKLSTEEFIIQANTIHNNKYDYSQTIYTGTNNPITVMCKEHGPFIIKPKIHIHDKGGCKQCNRLSVDIIKTRASSIHDNKYDYSLFTKYEHTKQHIPIICPQHGTFFQSVDGHLSGRGCSKCSKNYKSSTPYFINRAHEVHGDKYDYSQVNYKNSSTPVMIGCKVHGFFPQSPNGHLQGLGCKQCSDAARPGGYSMLYFTQFPHKKNEDGLLYLIEFSGEFERFYKIGITQQTVEQRYKYHHTPYNLLPIQTRTGNLFSLYTTEQSIIKKLKPFKYIPKHKFSGYTECFSPEGEPELFNLFR